MNEKYIKDRYDWQGLLDIVHKLRQPDGCPWDSTQTYESMKKCVMDEAQEVIEAIDNQDYINLREELGDLMLQVLMYAEIAQEKGEFTLEDVIDELGQKLVRRHPNVFTPKEDEELCKLGQEETAVINQEGNSIWQAVKIKEKKEKLLEYEKAYEDGRISKKLLDEKRQQNGNLTL